MNYTPISVANIDKKEESEILKKESSQKPSSNPIKIISAFIAGVFTIGVFILGFYSLTEFLNGITYAESSIHQIYYILHALIFAVCLSTIAIVFSIASK